MAEGTNEKDLEGRLIAFSSKSSITPGQSSWGRNHVLTEGQRMTRHSIFGEKPLDPVYNADGAIDEVFTTYERRRMSFFRGGISGKALMERLPLVWLSQSGQVVPPHYRR